MRKSNYSLSRMFRKNSHIDVFLLNVVHGIISVQMYSIHVCESGQFKSLRFMYFIANQIKIQTALYIYADA